MHPHRPDELLAFYEERVLPALYQRLDRAFPELEWAWTGSGWKGIKKTDGGVYHRHDQTAVVCNHPWGFVTRSGTATSWLAYINSGVMPQGVALVHAIRRLAELAGVAHQWQPAAGSFEPSSQAWGAPAPDTAYDPQSIMDFVPPRYAAPSFVPQYETTVATPTSDVAKPQAADDAPLRSTHHQRQVALWDAFVAFCHECLCNGYQAADECELPADEAFVDENTAQRRQTCDAVRKQLQQQYGLDVLRTDHLPLGVYPSAAAVHEHLLTCGFSQEEINIAAVVSDSRLPGRVIIPWRDALGRIATIIAEDITADDRTSGRRLYIKGGQRPALFGLDVALRPASGGIDELILVDHPLDVVFFQQHGIPNVAMMAGSSKAPTRQDWEILGDLGVCNVTLTLSDDSKGAARTCKSLLDAAQTDGAPQVFAIPFGALETCHGAGDFSRSQGLGRFSAWLNKRQHAYQYLAAALVRRHRPGKNNTRTAISGILREAMALDAAVYTPQREAALDGHFWGEILATTRVNWRAIRPRLTHRPIAQPAQQEQSWDGEEAKPAPDLNWVNAMLHAAAEEQAEKRQSVWTDDPPPVHTPTPRVPSRLRMHARHATYEDIRAKAYELWERKGRPAGAEQQCWFEAEQAVYYGARTNGNRAA